MTKVHLCVKNKAGKAAHFFFKAGKTAHFSFKTVIFSENSRSFLEN